jgi:hypothetical protein
MRQRQYVESPSRHKYFPLGGWHCIVPLSSSRQSKYMALTSALRSTQKNAIRIGIGGVHNERRWGEGRRERGSTRTNHNREKQSGGA